MSLNSTTQNLLKYNLMWIRNSGFINNFYFPSDPLKLYLRRSNVIEIISAVRDLKNKNYALYFGPGFGILLPASSEIIGRIVSLDVHEIHLTAASKIINDQMIFTVNLVHRTSNVEFNGLYDESFNCIIEYDDSEHKGYHDQILENFCRIFRADGFFIISLLKEKDLYELLEGKDDAHTPGKSKEIRFFLRNTCSDLIEIRDLDEPPIFLARIFSKLVEV